MPKKAPKMTEEERLQWEQDKAAAEAEAERAEKEMILNYMKDKFAREEKYSKLNNKKLIEKWRSIMRQSKSAELKKELEILSHTFERIMDRKDANAAVNDQQDRYNEEINMETSNFDETAQTYVDKTEKSDHDFDTMMCALEQTHIDKTSKLKQEFQSLRDEIKNNTQDEKHALRISLEAAVEKLFKMFQQAQKDYDNSTLERRKEFEKLQAKDAKSSAEIELQMNKLAKIQENINIVKQKMVNNTKEYEEKHAGLKENKDHLQTHFRVLRTEMSKQRNKEREMLTKLTLASEEALKRQKSIDEKASKILKIGEMCRKLETEEEQVLPFGIVPPTPRSEEEDKSLDDGKPNPSLKSSKIMSSSRASGEDTTRQTTSGDKGEPPRGSFQSYSYHYSNINGDKKEVKFKNIHWKDRASLPIGNGSYLNPVLIGNLPADTEMPGLRKIERESLPVIDDSWFHQVQSRLLVEFYKLQNALGIGDNKGMDEEKLLQVERDIPDWVGNRYLYFNRGLNRLQAEKALLSGLADVNQRRLFNWQEIANSPIATQCDLNTLKDMQKHAAKLDTIPFRQSFVQSSFYQAWRDRKKELESQGIPFEDYVIDKQYEDFLRGPNPDVARAELTKVLGLSLYAFLAARMTYARLKIVSYIKVCFVINTATCFIVKLFFAKGSRLLIPTISFNHVAASFLMMSALVLTNMSLEFVPYPAKILIKSCRPIPVFFATLCLANTRHSLMKILSVLLLLVGILIYMIDERGAFNNSALFGNIILFVSICLDGLAAFFFEKIRSKVQEKNSESSIEATLQLVASINFIAIFLSIPALFINNDVYKAYQYLQLNSNIVMPIFTSTFSYALGQIAIGASYLQFGTLSTSMAQTLRIMITLIGTVVLFHDPFSGLQMIGTSFMLLGIFINFAQSFRSSRSEEEMLRTVSFLDDPEKIPLVDSDDESVSSQSSSTEL
ncbi:Oidioi.mRNA.OKI2018_I69.PAR.g12187.t1.cds [Oikopleura dioica]|uniref:Dynein regulatory complex subunit 2 n=1 Tax=Oikopleura dioica TaxID=34765 RepID=A0ABN7S3U1_OIKDI|nr:Oidioi.mRNA.OKI2018_I69.PAR.g12187.t1.cds [Oikopleura dioica]